MDVRKGVVGQRLGDASLDEISGRVHPGGAQIVDNGSRLPVSGFAALLSMNSLEHMADLPDLGRWHVAEDIAVEMNHAALPSRLGQVLRRAFRQAAAGIGNDQLHPFEATIDQVAQKGGPAGFVLLGTLADTRSPGKTSELTALATSSETLRTSPAHVRFMTMPSR